MNPWSSTRGCKTAFIFNFHNSRIDRRWWVTFHLESLDNRVCGCACTRVVDDIIVEGVVQRVVYSEGGRGGGRYQSWGFRAVNPSASAIKTPGVEQRRIYSSRRCRDNSSLGSLIVKLRIDSFFRREWRLKYFRLFQRGRKIPLIEPKNPRSNREEYQIVPLAQILSFLKIPHVFA